MSSYRQSAVAMAIGVVVALAAAGCSEGEASDPRDASYAPFETTIEIRDSRYVPRTARVLTGGTVTFINHDPDVLHNAQTRDIRTTDPRIWDKEADFDTFTLSWGEPYQITFHQPARLEFFCSYHDEMRGVLDVVGRDPKAGPMPAYE